MTQLLPCFKQKVLDDVRPTTDADAVLLLIEFLGQTENLEKVENVARSTDSRNAPAAGSEPDRYDWHRHDATHHS